MEHDPAVVTDIKKCFLAIETSTIQAKKRIDDVIREKLKWIDDTVVMSNKESTKLGNTGKRRGSKMPATYLSHEYVTQSTSATVSNVINIAEAHFHIANESISCRTRGALRALSSSVLSANIAGDQTETKKPRGRSRIRKTKQTDTVVIKRTADEEMLGVDAVSKKIKKEKLSMIETPKKSDDEIFKKPKPRSRNTKKAHESALIKGIKNDSTIDESVRFNAVLHSSPNGYGEENTFLVSPKNLSVILKSETVRNMSPKEEVYNTITHLSTSNDLISDGESATAKLSKTFVGKGDLEKNQNKKASNSRTNRNSKELIVGETLKTNSSELDIADNNKKVKSIDLRNTGSKQLSFSVTNAKLFDNKNGAKLGDEMEEKMDAENDEFVDSSESSPAASPRKTHRKRTESGGVIREIRTVEEGNIIGLNVKSTQEGNEDGVSLQDLNFTKTVPKATKRTKPVLKSNIFDSKGNILPGVNSDKDLVTTNSLEKPYTLRSSFTSVKKDGKTLDAINVKELMVEKEIIERRSNVENEPETKKTNRSKAKPTSAKEQIGTKEIGERRSNAENEPETKTAKRTKAKKINTVEPMEPDNCERRSNIENELETKRTKRTKAKKINTADPMEPDNCERRSNIENELETKRTKRTKAKKMAEAADDACNIVRITRTKSKEAKKISEEAAVRKNGILELARKSLNKAKLISLQKDQPKNKLPLANRLLCQKPEISVKDNLLGSANKLNFHPIVNLGSQVKVSKIQCLKNNENLLLTGKGKYQNILTDSKDKYITPGKRCLSPDMMIKSASKMSKEEEIEKELKLRALMEKEEEALMKKEKAIKMRQKELKEKNEKKLELAAKQRKKLEMEKYNSKMQQEREKEEKRKLLLAEREMMKKEKARLKRELMEQKLADTEERRRLEEAARIAKLKEQEAEQQRIMLEKQKELERHEKRAQERLAEQKARENYEMKLKTEQKLREKQLASQLQSANKAATAAKGYVVKKWNYKPRNENDYGLDDENSDLDSQNEDDGPEQERPIPKWAQRIKNSNETVKCWVKKSLMLEYMKPQQRTPDIHKMFKMTPTKRIKRTSSAIWNTPSS